MACSVHTTVAAGTPPVGPPMTRCECADASFEQVASAMRAETLPLDQVLGRTGCGQTCEACIPDLLRFLAGRV